MNGQRCFFDESFISNGSTGENCETKFSHEVGQKKNQSCLVALVLCTKLLSCIGSLYKVA